jgi:deoxyribodipyrimidine photo-lyase
MSTYPLSLFIFRRDLRLQDNTALIEALKTSKEVLPCFIFDKRQLEINDYKSDACIQFMAKSLQELSSDLTTKNGKLFFFYGIAEEVVAKLIKAYPIKAVYFNRDYTPFSKERDANIQIICQKHNIDCHTFDDALLHAPDKVLKADGKPYTVFTPYFHKAMSFDITPTQTNTLHCYFKTEIPFEDTFTLPKLLQKSNPNLAVKGGRKEALSLLKKLPGLKSYEHDRDIPAKSATSFLSAHNKFGTISIREFYHAVCHFLGEHHTLIKELYWRDFFTQITFHFPYVIGSAFYQKYNDLVWDNNDKFFRAWSQGNTGFPIVDAGMRELNITGYMHNRVRMITASFLTKDLHIDWRWGEKYFAQKLIDYDPAVNNGNWQWAASTGCDAQPYFRIFNPWLQHQKFDPECLYIKKWIPELARIPANIIHSLNKNHPGLMTNYPQCIVNHAIESAKSVQLYKI